jgi:hypothetical protein
MTNRKWNIAVVIVMFVGLGAGYMVGSASNIMNVINDENRQGRILEYKDIHRNEVKDSSYNAGYDTAMSKRFTLTKNGQKIIL